MIAGTLTGKIGRAVARWRGRRMAARTWRAVRREADANAAHGGGELAALLARAYELERGTAPRVRVAVLGASGGGDPRGALLTAVWACGEAARASERQAHRPLDRHWADTLYGGNDASPDEAHYDDGDDDDDDD